MWVRSPVNRCSICMCTCWVGGISDGRRGREPGVEYCYSWELVVFEVPQRRNSRYNVGLFASFLAHCAILFLLLHREPAFVKPSSVAWGRAGASGTLIYAPARLEAAQEHQKLHFNRKPKRAPEPPPAPVESARAGSLNGSAFSGPSSGVDARPAIPLQFPDPDIFPWQLSGLKGDVIVEV